MKNQHIEYYQSTEKLRCRSWGCLLWQPGSLLSQLEQIGESISARVTYNGVKINFPVFRHCTHNSNLSKLILDIATIKSCVSSMKQEYISYWQNTLQHSQKLEFYRSFKTDHTSSRYLDLTRGPAWRRALVKLRISNHKLMIEIGRYNQTTKDNRHCPFCGYNVIEDEVHFLFQCPTYPMNRNTFYYKVKTLIPNIS